MEEILSPIEFTDSVACMRLVPMMFTYTICHAKLDKSISIEDVKALLSAGSMFALWRGAHILCEYRLAPGAILHAGTERAGLTVRYSRRC